MSITSYSELVTAVDNWMHRGDLSARAPEFITLAEAKFNRKLRVEDMVTEHTDSISAPEIALPDDFLKAVSLSIGRNSYDFKPRTQFFALEGRYYTRRGRKLILAEALNETADVSLFYYARIPALSDSNQTNWLLTAAPDLYLYGALLEAVPYMKLAADDTRPALWASGFQGVLADMGIEDDDSRFSGQALTISIPR